MTKTNLILSAILAGQLGGIATYGIEPISTVTAMIASLIMIVAGIYIYLCAGLWEKIAITPIFLSSSIYLPYSVIPSLESLEAVDFTCMLLESIAIIFIAGYFFINRRGNYVRKQTKETNHPQKTHTAQEMIVLNLNDYRHKHEL